MLRRSYFFETREKLLDSSLVGAVTTQLGDEEVHRQARRSERDVHERLELDGTHVAVDLYHSARLRLPGWVFSLRTSFFSF